MSSVTALSRTAAVRLVKFEAKRTGSRMIAYDNVARIAGTSADWLRKFISPNCSEAKRPDVEVGFNLIRFYSRVCDRVEQAGAEELKLKEEIDATLECVALLVERETGTD